MSGEAFGLAVADQIRAATREAREKVAQALDLPAGRAPTGGPLAETIVDRYIGPDVARCRHIAERPVQPMYLFPWAPAWRCATCVAALQSRWRAEGHTLGAVEEHTCDLCRRHAPNNLTQFVICVDLWIVIAAVCPACLDDALRKGAALTGGAS